MNYLLDTHTFLWFLDGSNNLSMKARTSIENPENSKFISIASIWEIAIKMNLGKLKLDFKLEDLKEEIIRSNFEILPLDFEHLIELSNLEVIHNDPFDRIIISQAIAEKQTIISKDSNLSLYSRVNIFW
ncbi:MAG TPA: PIN domain nuclease [Bacteroidetes bacterium]|nr:PIN domain nuclease [Bacteroidota bacterium]